MSWVLGGGSGGGRWRHPRAASAELALWLAPGADPHAAAAKLIFFLQIQMLKIGGAHRLTVIYIYIYICVCVYAYICIYIYAVAAKLIVFLQIQSSSLEAHTDSR